MNLVRTGLLNGIAVAIRMLSAVILNKVLAIYVGPAGYALIGQFQNLVAILTTFASGAVNTGVTKGTAEHFDDPERQVRIWQTAGTFVTVGACATGALLAAFHQELAHRFLSNEQLSHVFIWLGVSLVFIGLNGLLLAILNGKKQIFLFVAVNIAGSLIGLMLTGALSIVLGVEGALIALSVNQAIVFLVSVTLCIRQPWFRISMLFGRLDRVALTELLHFAALALTAAAVKPLVQILIRDHLIQSYGVQNAGYWEALMRISSLYLSLVTVPLSIYYLPRFAEIRSTTELKREIRTGLIAVAPIALISSLTLYLSRDVLVVTLFTPDFLPMRDLFRWQLAGDVLKIVSWLLGYALLAKGKTTILITLEIGFGVTWLVFALLMSQSFGVQGVQMGYTLAYLLYALGVGWTLMHAFSRETC